MKVPACTILTKLYAGFINYDCLFTSHHDHAM